jgi:energy-coupling factor transporter transmembrane protein EcfT
MRKARTTVAAANTDRQGSEDGMVAPGRQALMGAVLLVVGCLVFAGLVVAGANVLSGVGLVLAVWGLALLVNALVLARRDRGSTDQQPETGFDKRGLVALVLAFVVPPIGVLVAAYSPVNSHRGRGLQPLAIAVGAVLTVLYTFGIVLTAAFARSPT